jgi:uncharacterized membrane protein
MAAALTLHQALLYNLVSHHRIGAWLGTITLFNVWVLIWPNQKKILAW